MLALVVAQLLGRCRQTTRTDPSVSLQQKKRGKLFLACFFSQPYSGPKHTHCPTDPMFSQTQRMFLSLCSVGLLDEKEKVMYTGRKTEREREREKET